MSYRGALSFYFADRVGEKKNWDKKQELTAALIRSGWKKVTTDSNAFTIDTEDVREIWRGIELVGKQSTILGDLKTVEFHIYADDSVDYPKANASGRAISNILERHFPDPNDRI